MTAAELLRAIAAFGEPVLVYAEHGRVDLFSDEARSARLVVGLVGDDEQVEVMKDSYGVAGEA